MEPIAPTPTPGSGSVTAARRRAAPKSARRRAREAAMQGLYEWLVAAPPLGDIQVHMRELDGFGKCDVAHFEALLKGCIEQSAAIDALLVHHLDRAVARLSPVEHAVLMIGTFELQHCPDIPYRVAINEAVELAKSFGGTDGHKYVNGVLDKAAAELRPIEVHSARERTR